MKQVLAILLVFMTQPILAQYRYDNVAFKTVHWDELCNTIKQNPGLLLDVRSKGEYEDTSGSRSLNIGHLRNAKNIDIREIANRLKEIEDYKNKPVYVYCSHSQRSRRVSKMLTDSGFLKVYNINGGVSNLRMFGFKDECDLLQSNLPYTILPPRALTQNKINDYFIVDVRSDSSFRGIASIERKNAFGKFDKAVNIPLPVLEKSLSTLPKGKQILVVDELGSESVTAAELLHKNGFTNLSILFNGLDAYITEVPRQEREGWTSFVPYQTISAINLDQLAGKSQLTILDIRTSDEFNNASKESFRNIGNLKGAINIPYLEWDKQFSSLPADKEKPIVVYAVSSTNEIFETAKKLSALGYKNVNVLMGGLFNLRWRAANLKGHAQLNDWVVNVPPDNQ